ncbi:hypothetical protein CSA17_00090 [bacterium DOLJORAL78_65_58]|nr:MAG: hypothetical protein CSB20_04565 [bacterium DOLZORAL124_64_63]PIE76836.1 MAG: hypothetical protein CSA17_00090 [bacterium DOLJORAL78_65_58]
MMKRSLFLISLLLLLAGGAVADIERGPWVVTTDYEVFGGVEALEDSDPWTSSGQLVSIPSDAVARWHDGLVYVVGRGAASLVQIYNPAWEWTMVGEFPVGEGSNPQDIVFPDDGTAWISCYDAPILLQVDLVTGTILRTLDTSIYADADGLPETGWMHLQDGLLYIACQNLDRNNWFQPTGPGRLLVLDTATAEWREPIALEGANPYTQFRVAPDGRLMVGCAGSWAIIDGGIEAVDLTTGQTDGLILTEAQLGGEVLNFVPMEGGIMYALTSDSSFNTSLIRVQVDSAQVSVLESSMGFELVDLAWDGDFQIYVADRNLDNPGIRVFDSAAGNELTSAPVALELPPFMIVMATEDDLSPAPLAGNLPGRLELGMPFPNPCNPAADLVVHDAPGSRVRVSVFDLRGHRVDEATLVCGDDGRSTFRFTGESATGRALAAGTYRMVAQSAGGFAARTITLVK